MLEYLYNSVNLLMDNILHTQGGVVTIVKVTFLIALNLSQARSTCSVADPDIVETGVSRTTCTWGLGHSDRVRGDWEGVGGG